MKYELFRLEFQTGVHFGNHNLDESESGLTVVFTLHGNKVRN